MADVPSLHPYPDLVRFQTSAAASDRERSSGSARPKIVAIGSSSTAGAGRCRAVSGTGSSCALRTRNTTARMIDVVNRGIGGQEAPEELSRFENDVLAEAPALVIWQVGTNAVFRNSDYNPST